MTETRVLDGAPGSLPLMLKAALPALPGVGSLPGLKKAKGSDLPDLELLRRGVAVDPAHVSAYASVCGFPRKDTLPLPYLHMLAFPLHMTMLTDAVVPVPGHGHGAPREHHHPAPRRPRPRRSTTSACVRRTCAATPRVGSSTC